MTDEIFFITWLASGAIASIIFWLYLYFSGEGISLRDIFSGIGMILLGYITLGIGILFFIAAGIAWIIEEGSQITIIRGREK